MTTSPADAARPNFLVIFTDQHKAEHLGCYGHKTVRTPHIDSIAAKGFVADRFYVATPICMPNRSTFMTGRLPSQHGVRHNGIELPLAAVTFVDLLRAAGYRTALIGKSHLQNMIDDQPRIPKRGAAGAPPPSDMAEARRDPFDPRRYGQERPSRFADPDFDTIAPFYGFDRVRLTVDHADLVSGHYPRWVKRKGYDLAALNGPKNAKPTPDTVAPQAWRTSVPEELYPSSFIVEETISALQDYAAAPGKPFFVQASFPDPHHPFTPPGKYWNMYSPADMELPPSFKPADNRSPPHKTWLHRQRDSGTAFKSSPALFAATEREVREAMALTFGMIAMIDDGIGRILAELKRLGLEKSTVIVFTTDHGDYMGEHQLLLKGPLHYQGIVRQPFVWHDPAAPQNGRRTAAFAGMQDIAPTVLERAGLQPFNGMHGRSLLGLIEGRAAAHRDAILIEEEGQRVYLGFEERVRCRTLIDGTHRITLYADAAWGELYDWRGDPHELVNLWDDPAHARAKSDMLEKLGRAMLEATDTSPYPTSIA